MFRKFFAALANLVSAVDTLTASVHEANTNFRANLALDHKDEPEQLDHTAQPSTNGNKRTVKAK